MRTKTIVLVSNPVIWTIASMKLEEQGVLRMADWVSSRFPACTPEGGYKEILDLLPHEGVDPDGHVCTDNELLVEIAGRKCYNSFAEKASPKSNRDYIANTQRGDIPHASIMYHAKKSYFMAGISRRVSHELIRNYVGADRTEEGNPSQESTRYVEHPGFYIVPPKVIGRHDAIGHFRAAMQHNYDKYLEYIDNEIEEYKTTRVDRKEPQGMDRKRIYEAASGYLSHNVETSFVWTTNPAAELKLFRERCDEAADLEMQRFAKLWRSIALDREPSLYPKLLEPAPKKAALEFDIRERATLAAILYELLSRLPIPSETWLASMADATGLTDSEQRSAFLAKLGYKL